jgi:hypothetical protein
MMTWVRVTCNQAETLAGFFPENKYSVLLLHQMAWFQKNLATKRRSSGFRIVQYGSSDSRQLAAHLRSIVSYTLGFVLRTFYCGHRQCWSCCGMICSSLLCAPREFASLQLVWERICSLVILTRSWSRTSLGLCGLWSSLCQDWTWLQCQEHRTKPEGEILVRIK